MLFKKKNTAKPEVKSQAASSDYAAQPGFAFREEVAVGRAGDAAADGPIVLDFGKDGSGVSYLSSGWSEPEATAVWSDGDRCKLDLSSLPLSRRGGWNLKIRFSVYLWRPQYTSQRVDFSVGGAHLGGWTVTDGQQREYDLFISEDAMHGGSVVLDINVEKPLRPASVGLSSDPRALGVYLSQLTIQPAA